MFIDDITIKVKAGSGGKGAVAFNKNLMSLGPAGGSGGSGGNLYIEAVSDLAALNRLRFKKEFHAENGQDGRPQFSDGTTGKDPVIHVPVGTVIHDLTNGMDQELVKIGERVLAVKGGKGGRGNFQFRSSTNTTPKEFEYGVPGEQATLRLELKYIADVGFIGLPNVGKSSLLNELTNAKAKVANYRFTTLEPNLGVFYDLILADIPGLIEGASTGKGLGIKFLRHIERTKVLFHFIAADSENPAADYKTVRAELAGHHKKLLQKPEYVFLTKTDAVDPKDLKKKITVLKKLNKSVHPVSIYDFDSVEQMKKILQGLESAK
ncbi:MAG: GTPase ObgE [Candidatus Sungbacteria bacterium]|nr:GTPase ObgE [Candidatus Sungbacteria bacterium]